MEISRKSYFLCGNSFVCRIRAVARDKMLWSCFCYFRRGFFFCAEIIYFGKCALIAVTLGFLFVLGYFPAGKAAFSARRDYFTVRNNFGAEKRRLIEMIEAVAIVPGDGYRYFVFFLREGKRKVKLIDTVKTVRASCRTEGEKFAVYSYVVGGRACYGKDGVFSARNLCRKGKPYVHFFFSAVCPYGNGFFEAVIVHIRLTS